MLTLTHASILPAHAAWLAYVSLDGDTFAGLIGLIVDFGPGDVARCIRYFWQMEDVRSGEAE